MDLLATVEYGAAALHIPLLVVMGHDSCDAVKAATAAKPPFESPNLDYALRAIQAALLACRYPHCIGESRNSATAVR